jgi:hypothetical protein
LNHSREIHFDVLCSAGYRKADGICANNLKDNIDVDALTFSRHERPPDERAICNAGSLWPPARAELLHGDMQSGIGPFVGVFLQAHDWATVLIGTAMMLGNVAGMLITMPIGGFIDATNYKRSWIIIPGIGIVATSLIVLLSQDF